MTPEDEVREVMARYCWHVDHQQFPQWLALFAPDCAWGARGARLFEGSEAMAKLAAGLAKKAATGEPQRHFAANLLVEVDGDRATLRSYVAVIRISTGQAVTVGEYEVTLVKLDGRWKIQRMLFDAAAATTPAGSV